MSFRLPAVQPDFAQLKTSLSASKLQIKDNPLYQTIFQIIERIGRSRDLILDDIKEIEDFLALLKLVTFVTINDETSLLPNSSQILPGTGVTFNTTINNQLTIDADIEAIALLLAGRRNTVKSLNVDLLKGRVNGKVIVNGDFSTEEIGPIVIFQSPTKESEYGIITFAGEILDSTRMKLIWFAPFGAPRKTTINYISSTDGLINQVNFGDIIPVDHGGTGLNSYVIGDLLVADSTESLARLADIVAGNALISGGIGVIPFYGKIGLTTHISGRLQYANLIAATAISILIGRGSAAGAGDFQEITLGSGLSMTGTVLSSTGGGNALLDGVIHTDTIAQAVTRGSLVYGNSTPKWDELVIGAANRLLRSDGTDVSWAQVTLATDVSGDLPYANLAQGSALSVLGVTGNSIADNASIVAASDFQVLRRSGTAVGFGAIDLSQAAAIINDLPDANLTANVPLKNATNAFTGANSFATNPLDLLIGQLKFPATQNPSADANTLDDYEEGNWTPVMTFGGASVGITYSLQLGRYTKMGRFVACCGILALLTVGTSVGNAVATGLPFTIGNSNGFFSGSKIPYNAFTAGVVGVGMQSIINTSTLNCIKDVAGANTIMTNADHAVGSTYIMYFCFMTD